MISLAEWRVRIGLFLQVIRIKKSHTKQCQSSCGQEMHLFFVVHAVTLIIFLMQSGDIQLNPGPINKGIKKLYYMVHTENIIKVMHAVIVL